jgi:hypothetical protein
MHNAVSLGPFQMLHIFLSEVKLCCSATLCNDCFSTNSLCLNQRLTLAVQVRLRTVSPQTGSRSSFRKVLLSEYYVIDSAQEFSNLTCNIPSSELCRTDMTLLKRVKLYFDVFF